MKLGRIAWFEEKDFQSAKERGMAFIELDVNDRAQEFLDNVDAIRDRSVKYQMPIGAVGRWGSDRICRDGIREEELELEYKLIDAAAKLAKGFQELDIVSIVKPITKYAITIEEPNDIKKELDKAVYYSKEGRPGPEIGRAHV